MQTFTKPQPATSSAVKFARLIVVTAAEALAIYVWLRLDKNGHPWWGLLSLVLGEALETVFFRRVIAREARIRWDPVEPGQQDGTHFRRVQRVNDWAGNAEIGIWVLWLALAHNVGPIAAGVALLVLMHLKHHVEAVAIRNIPFRSALFSIKDGFASAMEVGGAVACLALIDDGRFELAAAVLGLGLLIEHAILIDGLRWEMKIRDVRLPRDPRWRPPMRIGVLLYVTSHLAPFWKLVQRLPPLERRFNRFAINRRMSRIDPRPDPLSTMADYTSWTSLTDRTFSGRHLPPVPPGAKQPATTEEGPPTITQVAELFAREDDTNDKMIECPKSTVLFSFFAQWVTDGFLRSERPKRGVPRPATRNTRKNESNHQIDLAQLYGLTSEVTQQLRTGHGLLKSQMINGEEYPQWLCYDADKDIRGDEPKPEFDLLPTSFGFDELSLEEKNRLFAMGTDTRNVGFMAFNVLFLREHNRIAGVLASKNPGWDKDRVFETARNILTVVLLRILVEEYINHMNASHFQARLTASSFPNEPWYRPNWMTIEFNLVYRWHSLVPSTFQLNGEQFSIEDTLSGTDVLTATGLGQFMAAASSQPAGRIGLFNTDSFLVDMAEKPSIAQARNAQLRSYNDYRRLCRLPPVARFDEISSDPTVQRALSEMYASVEDIEFYVGLFAEEARPNEVLPPLMSTMVGFDAFSQALTNPLLAPRIFNEQTFSPAGMDIIEKTKTISDLVNRNVPLPDGAQRHVVSLTRREYKRV